MIDTVSSPGAAGSHTSKAYVALERSIVTGELPPGSQWSEIALAERIGLGRTPTREALHKLAYQRLVVIAPRQGVFISEIDYPGQLKVIEARREIERLIVGQAAQWASDDERLRLEQLAVALEQLKQHNDMHEYLRLHAVFTGLMGEASRNGYAAEFYGVLQTIARRFLFFHQKGHTRLNEICDTHIAQARAGASGDVAKSIAASVERNGYAEALARTILMEMIATSAVTITPGVRGR